MLIDANDVYSLFDKSGFAKLHVADIDTIPRVDAVEVVRCKDCKFYGPKYYPDGIMRMCCDNSKAIWTTTPPDAFCSYGERKDGDGNG